MSTDELRAWLERFGGLDGALMLSLRWELGAEPKDRVVLCELRAYCNDEGPAHGWQTVMIRAIGSAVFGFLESPWQSNVVINYPVSVLEVGDLRIIDFDPLHPTHEPGGVKVSASFVGGREITLTSKASA